MIRIHFAFERLSDSFEGCGQILLVENDNEINDVSYRTLKQCVWDSEVLLYLYLNSFIEYILDVLNKMFFIRIIILILVPYPTKHPIYPNM